MNVEDLQEQVEALLEQYGKQCSNVVNEAVHEVSSEALKKLKKESPKRTGLYAKGWKVKKNDDKFSANDVLYGKEASTYAIAHLLEHGHAKRNGGRTAPIPHIKNVEEWAQKELVDTVEKKLKGVE